MEKNQQGQQGSNTRGDSGQTSGQGQRGNQGQDDTGSSSGSGMGSGNR